jgi:hypothetical protein
MRDLPAGPDARVGCEEQALNRGQGKTIKADCPVSLRGARRGGSEVQTNAAFTGWTVDASVG